MFDLFNVNNVEDLKKALSNCTYDKDMKYSGRWESAPAILSIIKLDEIGSLN